MRPPVLAVLAVALAFASIAGADVPEYVSKSGGYAIDFPGAPTEDAQEGIVQGAKLRVVFDVFAREKDQLFMVAYADIPASAAGHPIDDSSLVAQGRLIRRKDFKLFGHHARDVEVALAADHVLRVRIVDLGRRLYQIGVVMPATLAHQPAIDGYFGSFRLTR
jgi:hypothetical protein